MSKPALCLLFPGLGDYSVISRLFCFLFFKSSLSVSGLYKQARTKATYSLHRSLIHWSFTSFRSVYFICLFIFLGFMSEVGVKVMQIWLLLFEIFSCNSSRTCLIFPAITLLSISQTFSSQEYLSGINSLNKKSPKKKCKVHGH